MTPRIDLEVVIDVFSCLGVEAGLGLAYIAGAVDPSGSADVLKRPRLQPGDASWRMPDMRADMRNRSPVRPRLGLISGLSLTLAISAGVLTTTPGSVVSYSVLITNTGETPYTGAVVATDAG